jgi:stringent starvation protein B
VQGGEIVLNISFDATSSLQLGNEFIEFKARFGGKPCEIMVPIHRVMAIYARENGQGMSFPVSDSALGPTVMGMDKLHEVPGTASFTDDSDKPTPPPSARPTLTRVK